MGKKKINRKTDARLKRQKGESVGDYASRKAGWHSKKGGRED